MKDGFIPWYPQRKVNTCVGYHRLLASSIFCIKIQTDATLYPLAR